jgi:GNAT superfamily N-acetyltransferase
MPTIREAKPTDRDELLRMRHALQRHDEASNPRIWHVTEEGKKHLDATVDEMLSDEDGIAVVAEENGKPIGFAWGHVAHRTDYAPRTVGFFRLIYLEEGHRRRGTGTRMVREICRYFGERGVEEANLNYILGNREAEGFWSGLGFEPVRASANTPLKALEERLRQGTAR